MENFIMDIVRQQERNSFYKFKEYLNNWFILFFESIRFLIPFNGNAFSLYLLELKWMGRGGGLDEDSMISFPISSLITKDIVYSTLAFINF